MSENCKNTFTNLECLETFDGNTVIFKEEYLCNFFKTKFEKKYMSLTQEEKEEVAFVDQEYGDLLDKVWREPLQEALKPSGAKWALQDEKRNPIDEYKHVLSVAKDADISEEAHQAKVERLRIHAELFAKK
jgi:hypothetical protein